MTQSGLVGNPLGPGEKSDFSIQDPKLVEVRFQKKRAGGKAPSQHSRYFYLATRQLVFVVTASPSGESRLVTAYAPDEIRQLSLRVVRECADRV